MKHEQAPTAPKFEGVCFFFVDLKYILYENRYFWPIWQLPVGCFWPKWSKGASTDQNLSFEPITKSLRPSVQRFSPYKPRSWKPLFWANLPNLTTSCRMDLTEMVKRRIYGPKPFIWAYNQVSMTFHSKVVARTRKRWQTDRQTDGQTDGRTPQLYRPPTFGLISFFQKVTCFFPKQE